MGKFGYLRIHEIGNFLPSNRRHALRHRAVQKTHRFGFMAVFGAVSDGFRKGAGQFGVGGAGAQEVAHIENAGIVEAGFEQTLWRDADAVAGAAKSAAESRDDAHRPAVAV